MLHFPTFYLFSLNHGENSLIQVRSRMLMICLNYFSSLFSRYDRIVSRLYVFDRHYFFFCVISASYVVT
eukprot:UN00281